ncbi:MAG: UvrD-helicase domain-containing protein, partial [Saprospiraceae bacterium]
MVKNYPILYFNELDIRSVEKTFPKTVKQLQEGDFKSADVRKISATGYFRARLDLRDRLLFKLLRYEGQVHVLLLEVIKNHNYASSRFLRRVFLPHEDQFIEIHQVDGESIMELPELSYLNPDKNKIHLLNKFISFDQLQESLFVLHPPLIIIGSAGSGKTALVLEKMKALPGSVAYISLSKFLVDKASQLYYADGFENEAQDAEFLSLNDFLAQWKSIIGNEVTFRLFEPWYNRHAQALKIHEPYRVYEEFKGVISGSPTHTAWLSKDEYLSLGIKQSIFHPDDREKLHALFIKYLEWLKENNLYDINILCHHYLQWIKPNYDYILVDEVQDITNVQLKVILHALKYPQQFILTGDSNQIVHPNFFSWSKVKSYFHQSSDHYNQIQILQTNYRNSLAVVQLSNYLLIIKNTRFGSIDQESNYLVQTLSKEPGEVVLYPDDEKKKSELNRRTQNNTQYAVIVPDNADKDIVRKYFKTPLVFSVQEAKGLEYENVILVNFVSKHDEEFKEIILGVRPEDFQVRELQYHRSADKYDKDAEIYKFYINSFYVAITRAIKNIYLFEKLLSHPAIQLLQLKETKQLIDVTEVKSSKEEWLEEARRLEAQGKYEQAEQIRAKYLGYDYISPEELEALVHRALDTSKKEQEVFKERKQLFQYAFYHQRYDWIETLAKLQLQRAILFMKEYRMHRKEFAKNIRLGNLSGALIYLNKYGSGSTDEEGHTGIMLSAWHGQPTLVSELLKRNGSINAFDKKEFLALHYLFDGYFKTTILKHQQYANAVHFKQLWFVLRPHAMTIKLPERQIQLNGHSMAFFLLILMQVKEST